jgi:hypothetical protein
VIYKYLDLVGKADNVNIRAGLAKGPRMGFLLSVLKAYRKAIVPTEVKAVLAATEEVKLFLEVERNRGNESPGLLMEEAFHLVRDLVDADFCRNYDLTVNAVQQGASPRGMVWMAIYSTAFQLLTSRKYHTDKGTLDPTGLGPALLRLCDIALGEAIMIDEGKPPNTVHIRADIRRALELSE